MTDNTAPAIPGPPPKRKSRFPVAPEKVSTPNNLTSANENSEDDGGVDLNFKVPVDFHTLFKMTATSKRMKMKHLLRESFRAYLRENGMNDNVHW